MATEIMGIPIRVSYDVPSDEVWFEQGGKITGKIVNVGAPRPPTKREVRNAISLAIHGEWEIDAPQGWEPMRHETTGDSTINLTINGREYLVTVSIPRGPARKEHAR